MPAKTDRLAFLMLAVVLSAAAMVYWPGLHGPYLFDDYWNLLKVEQWAEGEASWHSALLPHGNSLINSRPIAMASFMLTTKLLGVGTFSLKFGNLLVHLAMGLAGFVLLRQLLRLDARTEARRQWMVALALTAIWLLHPLHVSTVLYAVQRMAQLGALFTLASVIVYLVARRQLIAGQRTRAMANLFVSFPILLLLGTFSKQNAVVAPVLCLVLEWAYFSRSDNDRTALRTFFGLFVALPLIASVALLALRPHALLAGYVDWDFTPWQRLLTQPRVLLDYGGTWFVPRSPRMGLYTDAFPVSTGILSPWTTLPALLLLAAISAYVVALRKRAPSVLGGWCFYLVAHGVEASFLPLEMYYEHRNYLPSWGLLLMAYGLASLIAESSGRRERLSARAIAGACGLIALALAFATLGRVLVWQDEAAMTEQALRYHPESPRLHVDRISKAYRDRDYAEAERSLAMLQASPEPHVRLLGTLEAIAVRCARDGLVAPDLHVLAVQQARSLVTVNELHAAMLQRESVQQGRCPVKEAGKMAATLSTLLDRSTEQPDWAENKIAMQIVIAELYALSGDWPAMERHAMAGWRHRRTLPLGVMLARAWTQMDKLQEAEEMAVTLDAMVGPTDERWKRDIDQIREIISIRRASGAP